MNSNLLSYTCKSDKVFSSPEATGLGLAQLSLFFIFLPSTSKISIQNSTFVAKLYIILNSLTVKLKENFRSSGIYQNRNCIIDLSVNFVVLITECSHVDILLCVLFVDLFLCLTSNRFYTRKHLCKGQCKPLLDVWSKHFSEPVCTL